LTGTLSAELGININVGIIVANAFSSKTAAVVVAAADEYTPPAPASPVTHAVSALVWTLLFPLFGRPVQKQSKG